jgi:hypothetical protein
VKIRSQKRQKNNDLRRQWRRRTVLRAKTPMQRAKPALAAAFSG